jgi:hypothetical protein
MIPLCRVTEGQLIFAGSSARFRLYVGGNLSHDDVNQKHFVLRLHVGVAGPDSELARCREEKMLCKDNTGQGMDGLVDMPPTLGLSQQTPALFHYSTLPLS